MVADEPVEPQLLAQLLEVLGATGRGAVRRAGRASTTHEDRGFVLVRVAGGYRFQSHPDLAAYVERFVLEGQSARLSAAALETLAIVAYKQPVSRAQVAAIRGVNVDGVMRTLQPARLHRRGGPRPRPRPGGALRHHRSVPREARARLARRPAAARASSCPAPTSSRRSSAGLRVDRRRGRRHRPRPIDEPATASPTEPTGRTGRPPPVD